MTLPARCRHSRGAPTGSRHLPDGRRGHFRNLGDFRRQGRYAGGVSLTDDVRAAEAAVLDLIDLDVATRDPTVSPQLRRRLTLMRQRREEGLPGVRLSVAAGLLG